MKIQDNTNILESKYQWLITKYYPELFDELKSNEKLSNLTYLNLSKKYVPKMFELLIKQLQKIKDDILPHDTKILRKQIATMRDFIDLFIYSLDFDDDYDIWKALRDDINSGYALVWEFKDLYDIQDTSVKKAKYDKKELNFHRNKVIKWKKQLLNPKTYYCYLFYINKSTGKWYNKRNKNKLFYFLWWWVEIIPNIKVNWIKNFSILIKLLIDNALNETKTALELKELNNKNNMKIFHNYRKRLRFIIRIIDYFPLIVTDKNKYIWPLKQLNILVYQYWQVNDKITKLNIYKKRWEEKKVEKIKIEIKKEFKKIKKLETSLNPKNNLLSLKESI